MHSFNCSRILVAICLWTTYGIAWPWVASISHPDDIIFRRQNVESSATTSIAQSIQSIATSGTSSNAPSVSATDSPSSGSAQSSGSVSGSDAATSGGSTSTATGSSTSGKKSGSSSASSKASKTTAVDPRLPPGGIQMITPSAIAVAQYYKIGDHVTFAWNYTSLSVTPSAIDVLVSCSANSATYTITNNASVDATGRVVWDTAPDATGTAPLLTEKYTLIVHDAAKDISSTPESGYLGTYNQFTFGMYVPQAYTPYSDGWTCATCSGALTNRERHTLQFLLGMGMITVLSFTWFAGGTGILY